MFGFKLFLFSLMALCPAWGRALSGPVYSVPISLPDLIGASQAIFVGTVQRVSITPPASNYGSKVQVVEFRVLQRLKGNLVPGQTLTLQQIAPMTSPLAEGETVLWFLPYDYSTGFSLPLGFHSGHFRIVTASSGEVLARSLNGNRNLWSEEKDFWRSGPICDRDLFLANLQTTVDRLTLLSYLSLADNPYEEQPLPLDFLVLLTRSCVEALERGWEGDLVAPALETS